MNSNCILDMRLFFSSLLSDIIIVTANTSTVVDVDVDGFVWARVFVSFFPLNMFSFEIEVERKKPRKQIKKDKIK